MAKTPFQGFSPHALPRKALMTSLIKNTAIKNDTV